MRITCVFSRAMRDLLMSPDMNLTLALIGEWEQGGSSYESLIIRLYALWRGPDEGKGCAGSPTS
jgi:hypothetical protein